MVLDDFHHFLLAISCALIASGGYLINNFYDYETDRYNKPKRLVVTKEWLINAYFPTTFLGLTLGMYVAWMAGLLNLAIVHIISTFILWKYAEVWKGKGLWGSIAVSSLLALLVFTPALFEFVSLGVLRSVENESFKYLFSTLSVYAGFAFMSNLSREIVKTIEDQPGDKLTEWNTFTVKYGVKASVNLLWVILSLSLVGLLAVIFFQFSEKAFPIVYYTLASTTFPLIACFFELLRASTNGKFFRLSQMIKLWMFGGISTLPVYFLFFTYG